MSQRIAVAVVSLAAAVALWLPSAWGGTAAAAGRSHLLRQAVPLAVASGAARPIGRLNPERRLSFAVTLRIRSWGALNRALMQESTPGSPRFGHYLSQNQANRLFNPTRAQEGQVTGWLREHGIQITRTYANHLIVDARGSVGAVDRLFHVSILRYHGRLYGRSALFFAPSTAPLIPAPLSRIVNGVVGLDNTSRIVALPARRVTRLPISGRGDNNLGGYYPSDYRAAYAVPSSETGHGQHIGVTLFDDPPSNHALTNWAKHVGLGSGLAPTTTSGRLVVHKVDGGVSSGDSAESGIDIENSYGMATSSVIDYWEFNDSTATGGMDALNSAGTTGPKAMGFNGLHMERQISSSWGTCEDSGDGAINDDPVMASDSATGHNFLFASGDTGSYCGEFAKAGKDDPFPQYPADSAYVLSVGGTAFGPGSDKFAAITLSSYPGEVAWYYDPRGNVHSDQCFSTSVACPEGSSGGFSNRYRRPSWQKAPGLGPNGGSCPLNGTSRVCRAFPDVAGPGDPSFSGAVICYSGGCEVDGGTSLATPVWAGVLADINSYLTTQDLVLGFANPAFYYLARQGSYHSDFHDVVCPNSSTATDRGCTNGKFATGPGWDGVTGLGTPNVPNLQSDLAR